LYDLCNDICKNDDGGFQCKCVPGRHLYTEDTRVVKQKTLWPNKTCIGMLLYLQSKIKKQITATVKPVLRGHLWDK
jgi:hypothetical protein